MNTSRRDFLSTAMSGAFASDLASLSSTPRKDGLSIWEFVSSVPLSTDFDWGPVISNALKSTAKEGLGLFLPKGDYGVDRIVFPPQAVLYGLRRHRGGNASIRLLSRDSFVEIPKESSGCRVEGICFYGSHKDGNAKRGLVCSGVSNFLSDLRFDGFSDEGLVVSGIANTLQRIFLQNCCLKPNFSGSSGALRIGGSDHMISNVESCAGGEGSISVRTEVPFAACYLAGSACLLSQSILQISDVGIIVSGNHNMISHIRCDKNYGHGFLVSGNKNFISNSLSFDNSTYCYDEVFQKYGSNVSKLSGTNRFDGFHVTGNSNHFIGCLDMGENVNRTRYGFYSAIAESHPSSNRFLSCSAMSNQSGSFSFD